MIDFSGLFLLLFAFLLFLGPILVPVGLGIIAKKRGYSQFALVFIGLLLGPVPFAVVYFTSLPTLNWAILIGSPVVLGYIVLVVALCLPKRAEQEDGEVTLPIPLPPGTRDWGDKR